MKIKKGLVIKLVDEIKIMAQRIRIPEKDRVWIHDKLEKIMDNGQFAHGKYVKEFEMRWATVCRAKYAVAMNSCTSALEVATRALSINKGKEIIVPTNTYGATVQACWNAGYHVKLIDICNDLMMDIDKIKWKDTIGAILFVGIGGNIPPRIKELSEICIAKDVPLILDNAHSHGVVEATKYGDMSCFSFYATKLITTSEGGALVTNNEKIAEYARRFRHHGRITNGMEWEHIHEGANYCFTEMQAILGISQIKRLQEYIENRNKIAEIYNEKFDPVYYKGGNWYKYIVLGNSLVKSSDITLSSPVYAKPIHQHPFWMPTYGNLNFPVANELCQNHFCLPMYNSGMTDEEIQFIMENVELD